MIYYQGMLSQSWKSKTIKNGDRFLDKKVLIVSGDSWTNNLYLKSIEDHWAYKLGIQGEYDYVFNLGTMGGSNEMIYDSVIQFLGEVGREKNVNFISNTFNINLIDIVIMWSSPIRDESTLTKLYQPFSSATIPDVTSSNFNSLLYKKYFGDWFRYEYHSYKTQLLTLFLQEFFEYHNISHKFLMAFSPLINEDFENTKWDLRNYINKDNFYGLYGFPQTVQDYLIQKHDSNFNEKLPIVEMAHVYGRGGFFDYFKNIIKKENLFFKRQDKFESSNHVGEFMGDGHPSSIGCTSISELVYKLLN